MKFRFVTRFQFAALVFLLASGKVMSADFPGESWERTSAIDAGLDEKHLVAARDYALTGEGSGYVTRAGKLVLSWGDPKKIYDLKSTTKSFGAAALGLAITDGRYR